MLPFHLHGLAATPLRPGPMLLEASAGTGKTYAIAGLVTRLVLELELRLERIAVMTFTRVATAELRDRIRARLANVAQALDGSDPAPDAFSGWMRDCYAALPAARQGVWMRHLRRAQSSVDAAPITTIHAFARRVATDHAASVGLDPAAAVTVELDEWRDEVVRDWFRVHLQQADPRVLRLLGDDPLGSLAAVARSTELNPSAKVATPPFDVVAIVRLFDEGARWWGGHRPRLIAHAGTYLSGIRKNAIFHPDKLEPRLKQIDDAIAGLARPPSNLADWWNEEKLKPWLTIPGFDPRIFTEIPTHLPDPGWWIGGLHASFAAFYRQAMDMRIQKVGDLHVGDALLALDACLRGEDGQILAGHIGGRYDAVLVDEFQDTDLLQWDILERCFSGPEHRLVLIGDPKQAIYAFRGADVYAYTVAKAGIGEDRRFTLTSNFRSDEPLLEALNALYLGTGRSVAVPDPFAVPDVAYHRVEAKKPVRIDSGSLEREPLQILALDEEPCATSEGAIDETAMAVSGEIARLLDPASRVVLTRGDGARTPLAPGDIAVLVRSHRQADRVHAHLVRIGIPAVRQDRSSVFHGEAAAELHAFIVGCMDPMREVSVRGAAATRYLGVPAADIIAEPPVPAMAALSLRLVMLGEVLERQGVAAWWYQACDMDFGWGSPRHRLASLSDGGRMAMDTLHLIELLAAESQLAPSSLVDWLALQRVADDPSEERARRLERDDEAVRILTVHVSKGLQYPVVFEAFAWQGAHKPAVPLLIHPGDGGTAERHLGEAERDIVRQAEREALGDDLRKLYVGLTRAMHRLYVIWAPVPVPKNHASNGSTTSALAWLLCGRQADPGTVLTGFGVVQECHAKGFEIPEHGSIVMRLPVGPAKPPQAEQPPAVPVSCAERELLPAQPLDRCWRRCSFTGLSQWAEHPDETVADDLDHDQATPHVPRADDEAPGGAALGSLVHELFEHADFQVWHDGPETVVTALETQLAGKVMTLTTAQTARLARAMHRAVLQPHPDLGQALAGLPAKAMAREWPVRIALRRQSPVLAGVFRGRTPMAPQWPESLQHVRLPAGVFTGILDALVCIDGRYHIIDWKTNLLDSYDAGSLWDSMAHSHYLLQAHLYLLAVHRFLRWRLPAYSLQRNLGVAAYAYVRGTREGDGSAGWAVVRPDAHILEVFDACC